MSISTGPVILLSCIISITIIIRYTAVVFTLMMIEIRIKYLTDHIIKLKTVKMRPLRLWTKVVQHGSHFTEYLSKSRAHKLCSAGAAVWRRKTFVARIFNNQIWQATSYHNYGCPMVISGNRANGVVKAWIFKLRTLLLHGLSSMD